MAIRLLPVLIVLSAAVLPLPANAKCADVTICRNDPITLVRTCKLYRNVCMNIIQSAASSSDALEPDQNISLELNDITQDQLQRVLGVLNPDKSQKLAPP